MLRFSERVRRSLASQLIRASWAGSGFFGLSSLLEPGSGLIVLAVIVWWFAFQAFGHIILAYEDHSDIGGDDDP